MTNSERLALLLQVQLQAGNWREALEDLVEDAEAAVIKDEYEDIRPTYGDLYA